MTLKNLISSILLEEEIGYIGTVDNYRISVEGGEGNIPHIHCVKEIQDTQKKFLV